MFQLDISTKNLTEDKKQKDASLESGNLISLIAEQTETVFPSYYNEDTLLTGNDFLRQMGEVCIAEFETDLASRSEWEKSVAETIRLFTNIMLPKTFPFKNCSNVNLPFITIAVLQFHARVYENLLPPKNIMQVDKTGFEDILPALRVEKFTNWQLRNDIPHFIQAMDKTLLQVAVVGQSFKKTFWNPLIKKIESRYLSAADLVVNNGITFLEDADRISHVLYFTPNEIRKRVKAKLYRKEDAWKFPDIQGTATFSKLSSSIKDMTDKTQGTIDNRSTTDKSLERTLIEQQREYVLDSSGIATPLLITIDYETKRVVRIIKNSYINEEEVEETSVAYTDYGLFPNPEGFYKLGFGSLLKGLNEAANTILNEVIDAGSLANLQGGYISKRGGLKKGNLSFAMGEYKEVDIFTDDIKKAMFTFDFKGPNQTLYAVLGLLYEYSKLVSSVSETMTGAMPASDTPAQTVLALIEEGRKVFSAIHKRLHESFRQELRKIFVLNKYYLDNTKYLKVLGNQNNLKKEGFPDPSVKGDFISFYDIQPVSDPNITSKGERIIKAKEIRDDIINNPLTASNMEANYKATKRYYESLDEPEVDLLLADPGIPDLSPEEENANFIREQPANVLPNQNHINHKIIHGQLETGSFVNILTPIAKENLRKHILDHDAAQYLNEQGVDKNGTA